MVVLDQAFFATVRAGCRVCEALVSSRQSHPCEILGRSGRETLPEARKANVMFVSGVLRIVGQAPLLPLALLQPGEQSKPGRFRCFVTPRAEQRNQCFEQGQALGSIVRVQGMLLHCT